MAKDDPINVDMQTILDMWWAWEQYINRERQDRLDGLHGEITRRTNKLVDGDLLDLYPYDSDVAEEDLPDSPPESVADAIANRVAEATREGFAPWLIDRIRQLTIQYGRATGQFNRFLIGEYFADESPVTEAELAEAMHSSMGVEFEPFGGRAEKIGLYQPPTREAVQEMLDHIPAHWDGSVWQGRAQEMLGDFGVDNQTTTYNTIVSGLSNGKSRTHVIQELRKHLSMRRRHKAGAVINTETARIKEVMTGYQFNQAAQAGHIAGYQWTATLDTRTCLACAQWDGQEFYYDGRRKIADQPLPGTNHTLANRLYEQGKGGEVSGQ